MFTRRLPALALSLALVAGNTAVCAGWAATPQARMACCAAADACPMHAADTHRAPEQVITQAEADSCCAASEGDKSGSTPIVAAALSIAVLGPGIILPITVPAFVLRDSWRTVIPIPSTPVAKHLLLSVFLV